jgi:hypothetical protein
MAGSQAATLAGIEPFASWNTPICWTGFILFADSIVYRARGNSWLRSAPREFFWLALLSIPFWLVFEFYNLFIENWYYTGLPENFWVRMFGYAWSYATIWPAIFEGAELISLLRGGIGSGRSGESHLPAPPDLPGQPDLPGAPGPAAPRPSRKPHDLRERAAPSLLIPLLAGTFMLVVPFVAPPSVARYLAAPVWIGFILLLDPINSRLGAESLSADLAARRYDRLYNLVFSGFLCGVLWEFWNYWSRAKWHYSVPIMQNVRIFEMPLPGYFGFPPFALECFTMYVFVRSVFSKLGRPIAM